MQGLALADAMSYLLRGFAYGNQLSAGTVHTIVSLGYGTRHRRRHIRGERSTRMGSASTRSRGVHFLLVRWGSGRQAHLAGT
jgi:hypothetical protein